MKRTFGLCIALTCVTAFAFAQQPGGGAGGRGGFGGGGFGGTTQLVQMEKVQTELKIKTGQKRRIGELAEQMRTEMQGMFNLQEFQGLGDEQRQQKMEELRVKGQEMQAKATAALKEILDDDQMDRLNELRLQQTGIRAIAEEDVAEQLGLTPAQKAKATKITTEAQQAMMQGFAGGGAGGGGRNFQQMTDEERKKFGEEMQKRREDMQKRGTEVSTDLTNVLTETQVAKWEEMQGEKFEFPAFGGRGGPGGAGGPGGGGAGGAGGPGGAGGQGGAAPPKAEEPAEEQPAEKPAKKSPKKSSKSTKKPK